MSLFNVFQKSATDVLPMMMGTVDENVFSNASSLKLFKKNLEDFAEGKNYHFVTGGQWSLHEVIGFILGKIGPADLWLSTWAITEDPARALLNWKTAGAIMQLHGIFDYKIKEQKSSTFALCENYFTRIHLTKCHAKVAVLRNAQWGVSIISSANLTRNPRIERGVICVNKNTADDDIAWMNAIMNNVPYFKVKKDNAGQ